LSRPVLSPANLSELLVILESLNPLFDELAMDFALLSGSWSRDQQHWWSDIDIFFPGLHFLL
ncbi:MAG: hypothetical protein ACTSP4_13345, partial [Candidatus Hodarchaeales archaeon]